MAERQNAMNPDLPALPDAAAEKTRLRARMRELLNAMTAAERREASQAACALLERQEVWRAAGAVLFYAAMPGELDLWPLLEKALAEGKTAALPRFDGGSGDYAACRVRELATDIQPGAFGVREPVEGCPKMPLNRLDLILVPGVAFDLDGRRLGRGKGHFDRLLAGYEGAACGVAFDRQIVSRVPVEPHDVHLTWILTPTRWHWAAGSARF